MIYAESECYFRLQYIVRVHCSCWIAGFSGGMQVQRMNVCVEPSCEVTSNVVNVVSFDLGLSIGLAVHVAVT